MNLSPTAKLVILVVAVLGVIVGGWSFVQNQKASEEARRQGAKFTSAPSETKPAPSTGGAETEQPPVEPPPTDS